MEDTLTTPAERLKFRALHGVIYGAITACHDPRQVIGLRHEVCTHMELDITQASDDETTNVMNRVLLLLE